MTRSEPSSLADLLRERTRRLHAQAERSGILHELLAGRASRRAYALWLRNLAPVYEALERALEGPGRSSALRGIALPQVYRSEALAADLLALGGPDWREGLEWLPAGRHYAERIGALGGGSQLVAHAYTRYLGDLNGGRILRGRLARSLGLGEEALGFYDYPGIPEPSSFALEYRAALDAAGPWVDGEAIAEEAQWAFRQNIELSLQVKLAEATGAASRR